MPSILLVVKHAELDLHNLRLREQISRDTADSLDSNQKARRGATPAGDEKRLRGIPAIGRGVGGAIPGTRP